MKARTIKSILEKKFHAFSESITDPVVRDLVEKNSIITGGSIASMLLNEKVNDFDIYFTDQATTLAVAAYYAAKFVPQSGIDPKAVEPAVSASVDSEGRVLLSGYGLGGAFGLRMDKDEVEDSGAQEAVEGSDNDGSYRILFLSPNAITLSDEVQIIIRFYGNPSEIHRNYDFVHCTNYWTSKKGELVLQPAALEALLTRELRYVGSKYPLCSIIRTRKFIRRGWQINAGQYLKMALQLNELDLLDIPTLQDQLIGVDSAHFIELLSAIQEKDDGRLTAAYVIEIIDRIF